jgi:hypothetical protein
VISGDVKTDVINATNSGVSDLGTGYKEWTYQTDNASYAGQSNGGQKYIQIRSDNDNSGLVSVTSGGKVRKVEISFTAEAVKKNTAGRTVDVYVSNTAFTAPTDLYDTAKQGKKVASFAYSSNDTLTYSIDLSDDYQFVGLRSASGAIYLGNIQITWEK